ncbi:hypothetical protein [Streptomyces spectabilis]|uniref:Uncharacterized protein n=1 Tax=Streptomyces spectabilis TaxID=68270 RepID=A0A5P2X4E3_STRST|nr:hypothetical protein [Streptomyces spectabilis]MBB5108320.1 hypothetical protein [Streptomyces spectabilis]MCI3901079.1 hypothetical protein [Streptomyces spectabilis]QEV58574.1 hypothetical protein CP982_07485 [Streptomyces spectabilis]GGV45849.1 hypothetical protein GCM10010245_71820 [Streptomyces spectabilis]
MEPLPGRPPLDHPAVAQRNLSPATQEILDDIESIDWKVPTSHRDTSPVPTVGDAQPVAQPGRPPMSQKATDGSALMLAGSVLIVATGGAASLVLWASGQANPVVIGIVCAAPPAAFHSLKGLAKIFSRTGPRELHQTYNAPVHQINSTVTTHNRWWGRSSTNL